MKQYKSRSISGSIDTTSEFELRLSTTAPAGAIYFYQNNERGGFYSVPLYTVPQGHNAKIMGIKVAPFFSYRYKTEAGGDWSSTERGLDSFFGLKINNHLLSPFGGLPKVSTTYTVTQDEFLYLNEGDTLEFVVFSNNVAHSWGSSSTRYYDAILDSFTLDLFISLIEEYEEADNA